MQIEENRIGINSKLTPILFIRWIEYLYCSKLLNPNLDTKELIETGGYKYSKRSMIPVSLDNMHARKVTKDDNILVVCNNLNIVNSNYYISSTFITCYKSKINKDTFYYGKQMKKNLNLKHKRFVSQELDDLYVLDNNDFIITDKEKNYFVNKINKKINFLYDRLSKV